MKVILAIDSGTTGNRVLAFSHDLDIVAESYYEFPKTHPKPGWVEQDAEQIWQTLRQALLDVSAKVGVENIVAIGITNQRETTIVWDRESGKPAANAIVWQDRRTADMCAQLADATAAVKTKTGLFIDPYFSATKIKWMLDHVDGLRARAEAGSLAFGTVDSWLIWKLTGGRLHATDPSNASRTLCFNIRTMEYDDELLALFGVPRALVPEVRPSNGSFGVTEANLLGRETPIAGVLGDQQSALFGQGGWEHGIVKNTYGTGLFLMASTGEAIPDSGNLINTIGWQLDDEVTYAIEGSVFVGGACLQWLRDQLGLLASAADSQPMAESLDSNDGVYFVPALAGLGAPYWDPDARGMIIGLTQGTTPSHIARAALEGIAYQSRDMIEEMQQVAGSLEFTRMRVDGGVAKNDFLMQFQADISGLEIERPVIIESTAVGAAAIAGMATGFWTRDELQQLRKTDRIFTPAMAPAQRDAHCRRWQDAVKRALKWEK